MATMWHLQQRTQLAVALVTVAMTTTFAVFYAGGIVAGSLVAVCVCCELTPRHCRAHCSRMRAQQLKKQKVTFLRYEKCKNVSSVFETTRLVQLFSIKTSRLYLDITEVKLIFV